METDQIDERFSTQMAPELTLKRNKSITKKLREDVPYQSVSDVSEEVTM